MTETPETIYLIPGEDVAGAPCWIRSPDMTTNKPEVRNEILKKI